MLAILAILPLWVYLVIGALVVWQVVANFSDIVGGLFGLVIVLAEIVLLVEIYGV